MLTKEEKEVILKYCLQNAVFYSGKANPGAVIGKVLGEQEKLRKKVPEVRTEIEKAVKSVNRLTPEEQKKRLEKVAPKLLEKPEKEQGLPNLEGAVMGKVVTRFAPAPTGPIHIAHLMRAVFLSYLYAKKYNGKFYIRFEDTDPKKVESDFYDWILEDLKKVGIEWDKVFVESENMETYYKYARELVRRGRGYVCECSAEAFRELKAVGKSCKCRTRTVKQNTEGLEKMIKGGFREGSVVLRLKTNMRARNPVLRDPPLMRVSEGSHPRVGTLYKAWPLYNFVCAIEDHNEGITHVFRAKEHQHNTAIQKRVYETFGWKPPVAINFGLIHLAGEKIHKRFVRDWIKSGKVTGWDDVKLPTIRALLRRGYQPKAFEEMAILCGLSKTDIKLSWENLNGINRKIIDSLANRYMAVLDPVRIELKFSPPIRTVSMSLHPDFEDRGKREMPVDLKNIWISGEDAKKLRGKEIRLIGLGNMELKGEIGEYTGNVIKKGMQKIQWVSEPNVKLRILSPEKEMKGLAEENVSHLKVGDLLQFERIGFGRVDTKNEKEVIVAFTHK